MNEMPTAEFTVSRERFEKVPHRRMIYIALYAGAFVLWMVFVFNALRIANELEPPPVVQESQQETVAPDEPVLPQEPIEIEFPPWMQTLQWVFGAMIVVFYIPFISVLRTMGYPPYLIAVACAFVFLPIPGLFALAYLDTRIAKSWTAASERFEAARAAAESKASGG